MNTEEFYEPQISDILPNGGKVSEAEYKKALLTIQLYTNQFTEKTVRVSVEYNATVSAEIEAPADMTVEEIKNELAFGYHDFDLDDEPRTRLHRITSLIVDGKQKYVPQGFVIHTNNSILRDWLTSKNIPYENTGGMTTVLDCPKSPFLLGVEYGQYRQLER
jgi:hypothetical protein